MSVIAAHRNISKLEVYNNALKIRKELENWLLTDFASKSSKKEIRTFIKDISEEDDNTIRQILDKYDLNTDRVFRATSPLWWTRDEQSYLLHLGRGLVHLITSANNIYVGKNMNQVDYVKRRNYQTDAILYVHRITEEIYSIIDRFPSDLNRLVRLLELLDKEDDLLRAWRSSEKKFCNLSKLEQEIVGQIL